MPLQQKIERDLREAMKARDKQRVSTLRLLLSQLANERLDLKKEKLLDDDVVRVVQKEVKRRKEAAEGFRTGGRLDDAANEEKEQSILEAYLPEQLSDEELEKIIRDTVSASDTQGAAAVGKVMGEVMKKVRGKADGSRVRSVVERILTS